MGKGRLPPKLLSRVLRTVAKLHESKGSSVRHIAGHIKKELTACGRLRRHIALEIRRALKYAVKIGALIVKAGKYKTAQNTKVLPVDSLEIVKDCRHRKAQRQSKQIYTKRTGRCKRDMYRGRKDTKRKKKKAQNSHYKKHQQKLQQQPLRQEPAGGNPPNNVHDEDEDEDQKPQVPYSTPRPHEKNQDLDKKKNNRDKDDRHQTPYPEYNDTMNGDDKKDLVKVKGRPRRPRRPILPAGRNQGQSNENEVQPSESNRSLHLHRTNISRTSERIRKKKEEQKIMFNSNMEVDSSFY